MNNDAMEQATLTKEEIDIGGKCVHALRENEHLLTGDQKHDFIIGYRSGFSAGRGAWHPIATEGLPGETGNYLISFRWTDEGPELLVGCAYFDDITDIWSGWEMALSDREIVAWQPLPEPYKEQS